MRKLIIVFIMALLPLLCACQSDGDTGNSDKYIYEVIDGYAVVTGYNGTEKELEIPAKLGGYEVTAIAENAFYGFINLTDVTIPDTVKDIHGAFRACDGLKNVILGSGVKNAEYAFELCTSLEYVQGGENIENLEGAFKQCISLKSGNIPSSCSSANYAFENCTALTTVLVEGSMPSLDRTFYACEKLTSAHIPSSVQSLNETFYGCLSLAEVTGGENVCDYSFSFGDCISLTKLTLGGNIKQLKNAFNGCISLSEISGLPTRVESYSASFNDCRALKYAIIPDISDTDSLAKYNPSDDFKNCGALETLQINCCFTVKEEFCKVFSGCMSLKNLTMPEVLVSSFLRPSYTYIDTLYSGDDIRIESNLKSAISKKTVRVTDDYGYVEDVSYTHIYGYDLDTVDTAKELENCEVKGFIPYKKVSYWFGYPKSGNRVDDTVAISRVYSFILRTTGYTDGTLPTSLNINGLECSVGNESA